MLPQMVNAYHYPEMNEIVFPAAILQVGGVAILKMMTKKRKRFKMQTI